MDRKGRVLLWIGLFIASWIFIGFVLLIVFSWGKSETDVVNQGISEEEDLGLSPDGKESDGENVGGGGDEEGEDEEEFLCGNYLNQSDCEEDLNEVGGCEWNSNISMCDEFVELENDESEEGLLEGLDLTALNLTLAGDCFTASNETTNETTEICYINVSGAIKNLGNSINDEFNVQFWDITNIQSGGIENVESYIIENINGGAIATFEPVYNVSSDGKYWIKIIADAHNEIEEIDENNNEITRTIEIG
jgi:hypothetical protein